MDFATTWLAEASGFAALLLMGLAAIVMVLRGKMLKWTRSLPLVRAVHLAISALAGLFIVLHVAILLSPPASTGLLLGYVSIGVSAVVWVTGAAFVERLRDSLFFHGTSSTTLIALSTAHAALAGPNIPYLYSELMLAGTVAVTMANASVQLWRVIAR